MMGFVALAAMAVSGALGAVAQNPTATATPPGQTMQMRQTGNLTQDSDPVPSPDTGAAAAAPSVAVPSQTGVITKENGHFTLRTDAYEVRLNVSVTDAAGKPVDGLPQSAFHVYEDGVLQQIVGFGHEDIPVSLGILIDSSGSMYDKRAAVDAASLNLVKLSNPKDEAFLVDFSTEPYLDQDFTSSIAKLQQGLSYIKSSGGTALYDAVIASADYLSKNAKREKQVLLIVTDGDDNASTATLEATIRRVQDLNGPSIYCIGLLFGDDVSHSEAKHAREVLSQLADQTGGRAYFPKALKDVDSIAQDVAQDIRTQYTIEYRSSKPTSEGGYRVIHVDAKAPGFHELKVRTKAGYFPTPVKPKAGAAGTKGSTGTSSQGATTGTSTNQQGTSGPPPTH
jgi:Ca-activated chloride channel family protein